MRNPIRAVTVPVVIATAIDGAAGDRAQSSGSGRRLDELGRERPAAATHFPIDTRQMELFLQTAAEKQALEAQRAQSRTAPARTGRGGGGGGSCNPESNVQRERKGHSNAVNPSSGASGNYQFLPSTWFGYGGYSRAQAASESDQNERFNEMWAGGAGSSHWGC
jgi:Transglycosylase-like domain